MQQYECILSARYLLPSGQRAERVVLQLVLCRASISSGLVKYNAVRMYIRTHARLYGCKCKQRTLKRAASNYLARCVYAQVLEVFHSMDNRRLYCASHGTGCTSRYVLFA